MNSRTLYIKNMVCPRCVETVREVLNGLGLAVRSVELGRAEITVPGRWPGEEVVEQALGQHGFELLRGKEEQLVERIKTTLIDYCRELEDQGPPVKSSVFLSEKLHHSYSHLSKLFSQIEGMTIEKYLILLKIERVKELLSYDELTLSEIAFRLKYSSVQHLSNQFKKVTGMTVSEYKQQPYTHRHFLDTLS